MGKQESHLWGIILAAGEGQRLQEFLKLRYNSPRPKQFSAIVGTRSMLRHTIDRVEQFVGSKYLRTVICRPHLSFVNEILSERERKTLLILPCNRETAPSILIPLLHIEVQDPFAIVVIFPSDHFIVEEERFLSYVQDAVSFVQLYPEMVALLGIKPHDPDPDYGWIEASKNYLTYKGGRFYRVLRFLEKPDIGTATTLFHQGGLWNSMVVIARLNTLLQMFHRHLPEIVEPFARMRPYINSPEEEAFLEEKFERLPSKNFSKCVLERSAKHLRVLRVEGVYWSDWGNQDRVLSDLARLGLFP